MTTAILDVSDEAAVSASVREVVDRFGGLDVLVNAAGILRAAHTHESTLDMWNQVIGVNLTGTYLMTRAVLPVMLDQGTRRDRQLQLDVGVVRPSVHGGVLGEQGWHRCVHTRIAIEYGKRGIRAVAVAPGSIESGITETTPGMLPPDADWSLFAKMSPVVAEGFAPPEVVASMIAALASDDGRFVSGTSLRIDGGAHG